MSGHDFTLLHRTRCAQGLSCLLPSKKSTSRVEATYHSTCGGSNTAVERALRKLAKQLGVKLQDFKIASLTATQSPRPWTSVIKCVAIQDNNRSLRCSLPLNQSYLLGSPLLLFLLGLMPE